jgi:hypothetical protein
MGDTYKDVYSSINWTGVPSRQRFCRRYLSCIAESGRVGVYIDSRTRLRYFGLQALYPDTAEFH